MFKNRFILVLSILSIILVTMAVSYPHSNTSFAADQASDFYQRHPDWTITAPNMAIPVTGDSSSYLDYYQRHPELSVQIYPVDLTDFFFRHPELSHK